MNYKTIHQTHHHFGWDNSLSPVMTVTPDTVIEFELLEASGGRIQPDSPDKDVLKLDPDYANPVTGPVFIENAEPGDTLVIEIQEFELSGWGWTAIIPDFGLLSEDFRHPFLHHSRYSHDLIEFTPDIHLPTRLFPGTIGVAPAEKGKHSAIPPRLCGGNLDCKDVTRGSRLYLPVQVTGALFSIGDSHAAQGDGEVCGTAIESPLKVLLNLNLIKGQNIKTPRLEIPHWKPDHTTGPWFVTMGVNNCLMTAAQDAVREMIDHISRTYDLSPELAYCLCSVAVDLKVTETVNNPNWVVSAYLPKNIFV